LSTRDTVAIETPAALAISRMVARAFPLWSFVVTAALKQIFVTGYVTLTCIAQQPSSV
jgi:hypothetical protein